MSAAMKFLFVGSSPDHGGAEVHFVALARALRGEGHEVAAMVKPDGFIAHELERSGLPLYERCFRNVFDPKALATLVRAIREFRPDALIGNFGKDYWPLALAGRMFDVPVALFRHRIKRMDRVSRRALPRLCTGYFAVSDYARDLYGTQGVPERRIEVLYNPVDTSRFRFDPHARTEIRRGFGIDDDAIVLGFCGRLIEGKGIHVLHEALDAAMALEPRLQCMWIGDGADAPDLRARIDAGMFAHRHHFTGELVDVHRHYSAMSMLAFPSIGPETFGRVSIEAQACGIPVIGSDLGGIPETLWNGHSGLLVPAGDVREWTRAILSLCDDARRTEFSTNTRAFVDHRFSKPIIARKLVGYLRDFSK